MSLGRKDVRHKLDHEYHSALLEICDVDCGDIADCVEHLVMREVDRRAHDAREAARDCGDPTVNGADALGRPDDAAPQASDGSIDSVAMDLYQALRNTPCACAGQWWQGKFIIARPCRRCRALASFESMRGAAG